MEEAADRRRRRARRDVLAFWSADWTPWQALRRARRDWPALILAVTPQYDTSGAEPLGEAPGA